MSDPVDLNSLTIKQCECLELVLRHMTSKQIALELGISPYTVNQRLDAARQRLGVATRQEAALRYAKLKGIPESLAYHVLRSGGLSIENNVNFRSLPDQATHEPFMLGNQQEEILIDDDTEDDPLLTFSDVASSHLTHEEGGAPPSLMGSQFNRSEIVKRLAAICGMAILIMTMALVAIGAAQGLTAIFRKG